jgi:hypothetical protein
MNSADKWGFGKCKRCADSEEQKQSVPYRLAKIPMAKVRRTITISETRGFLKALIRTENDEILGFTAQHICVLPGTRASFSPVRGSGETRIKRRRSASHLCRCLAFRLPRFSSRIANEAFRAAPTIQSQRDVGDAIQHVAVMRHQYQRTAKFEQAFLQNLEGWDIG